MNQHAKNQATSSICPGNIDHLKIMQIDWQNYMRYYLITKYRMCTGTQKTESRKMKNQISETIHMLDKDKITDKRLRWEFLKYKIRKFTINLSKKFVKEENKDRHFLEKELKKLEKKPK